MIELFQKLASASPAQELFLLQLFIEHSRKIEVMMQNLRWPRKQLIVPWTWETEADLCDPAERMPDLRCRLALVQNYQQVRGFCGWSQYGTISLGLDRCVSIANGQDKGGIEESSTDAVQHCWWSRIVWESKIWLATDLCRDVP